MKINVKRKKNCTLKNVRTATSAFLNIWGS